MILAPSGSRRRLNCARLCVEELEPRNLLSAAGALVPNPPLIDSSTVSATSSPSDADDPLGLDLLLKIERDNAQRAQLAAQAGSSALAQGASHVAVAGDGSAGAPSGFTNLVNGTMTPAAANRLGQDSQTQLLAQILSNNNSSTMTAGLLASASSGHGSHSGPVPLSGGPPLVGTHYPSVTNPGNQTNAEGASVALQIIASSGNGDPMLFGSSGLPVGLTFDSATGLISGTLAYTDAVPLPEMPVPLAA
jgi:hypothetical protein